MADFTITISNQVDVFGATPASLWGVVEGDVGNWGYSSQEFPHNIGKFISNSQSLSDSFTKKVSRIYGNDLSIDSDVTNLELLDGNGYNYVFTLPTIDADEKADDIWTDESIGDVVTYTSAGINNTEWS